jgi:hypothetical protein
MDQDAATPTSSEAQRKAEHPQPLPADSLKAVESATKQPNCGDGENRRSDQQKSNWPSRVQSFCAVALVFITGFYTYYAGRQLAVMRGQLDVMEVGERPFVGVSEITGKEANGGATFWVVLKNFGKIPALRLSADWRFSINGVELTPLSHQGPLRAITLYPGANQALGVEIGEAKWTGIASGRDTLGLRATRSYKGPSEEQQYGECDEWVYDRARGAFRQIGECPPHPTD